ncbi:Ligand-binding domain of nuclear hormone receptor [Cooperia oncophora]
MRRTQSETFTQQQEDPNGFTEGNVVPHDSSVLMSKATARHLLSFSQTSSSFKRGLEEMVSYFEEDDGACEAQFQYPESTKPSPVMSSTASIPPTNLKRESIESAASGNMIEMMVKSYEEMLERRRLFYCPSSIRDILGGTKPTVRPACYFGERVRRDRLRVDIALLVEFLNSISPFPHLTLDDKVALMKKFSVSFSILEKYYITMRVGGLQTNRIFHSDGTYSDLDDPDSIAKEANRVAGGGVDRNTLNKLFIQSLKDFLLELSVPMYHNKMTDVEFCALNAVLLFDPAAPGLSEIGRHIVREARDHVYEDWFELYRKIGVEDIGQRVGNTMLLLPAVQTIVDTTQENFRLIQVFDLFQYDKILDELMYLDH